ncbi:FAD dependent oxidoreductase [Cucurbitaria berberidis CBS 394.84]|uniref:FAD dependent oxidoreductase n=1 Tax=Cucurbitaria berberidis CBS 394.84 TaxID=1168544 RepID=A0A9P4GGA8_9PLEO|nr:FAD dependent oxidoreductase [Cucurbitaria berberidis CBS 394.84]KAF1844645.1 FAD dependent oxidoreductase [Cucurbitaria berberidis CBS 394.84]
MKAGQPGKEDRILPVPDPVLSYWLSQPHKYSNVRSTSSLPASCDIAIIGSGMAGIVTAYHILKGSPRDKIPNVVILEARELCSGATARNGGHTKVKTATLANLDPGFRTEFQKYVLDVIDALKRIVDEEDLDCEFELRRSFDVFCDGGEAREMKRVYDDAVRQGEGWTKHVTCLDERRAEQVTSIKGAKVAFSVPAASLWPYKFVTQLVERLVERYPDSVNVQTNTAVQKVEPEEGGSSNDGGVNLLTTSRGVLRAKKVVFATNAYTAGLLPLFKEVIVPIKGMASHHHVPSGKQVHPHLNQTYNIHFAPDSQGATGVDYLNPRPDGGIVVGGGNWLYKTDRAVWYDNFDDSKRFSERVEGHWSDYMQSTFLGWEESKAETDHIWVGIMGVTPDGLPHVGRVPQHRGVGGSQWVLAGFNGGGMALIGTAAKAVAKMVLEDKDFDDVEGEFGLLRGFKTGGERLKKHGER